EFCLYGNSFGEAVIMPITAEVGWTPKAKHEVQQRKLLYTAVDVAEVSLAVDGFPESSWNTSNGMG
ncbi:hypothetical protein Tco_1276889, partial [Tanacetum coccineum]